MRNLPAQLLTAISVGRHFSAKAEYHGKAEQILIISRPPSSTIEIYLRPRLVNSPVPVHIVSLPGKPLDIEYFSKPTFVIISRYINSAWCVALRKHHKQITGIAYLMDDDIPEAGYDRTLPSGYSFGLALFFYRYWKQLQKLCSELWVSSPYLLEKYSSAVTHLIEPMFVANPRIGKDTNNVTLFYHAQRTHYLDIIWLRPIIHEIQKRFNHTIFETFGGFTIERAYASVPRARVIKRFGWNKYLEYCSRLDYDIGLAPLYGGGEFNKARSINKLFDISRCGAAGIYSNIDPYRGVIENGKTGFLCHNDPEVWIDTISMLIENERLRKSIYNNCYEYCIDHNIRAVTPENLKKLMR